MFASFLTISTLFLKLLHVIGKLACKIIFKYMAKLCSGPLIEKHSYIQIGFIRDQQIKQIY